MLSEYYKDDGTVAQVHKKRGDKTFFIVYTDEKGFVMKIENFEGKSLRYVEDAAENYALGIKQI